MICVIADQKGNHMNRSFRKFFSILLSVMMLAGNTQVRAEEGIPSEETAEEETVLIEEQAQPAEEEADLQADAEAITEEAPASEAEQIELPEEAELPETAEAFSGGDIETPEIGDDPEEEIIFILPQEIQVPMWSGYELKQYTLIGASIDDVRWETNNPDLVDVSEGPLFRFGPEGEADITGTLVVDGITISTQVMHVVIHQWYAATSTSIIFSNTEPEDVWFKTLGLLLDKEFTIQSSNTNIVTVEKTGEYDDVKGTLYRVTPVSPGITQLVMLVSDPNDPDGTDQVTIPCQDITVCSDGPLESIEFLDPFTGEPVTEITMNTYEPYTLKMKLIPETYNPLDLSFSSSDETAAEASPWEDNPLFVDIYPLQPGNEDVIIRAGSGDATAAVTVHFNNESPFSLRSVKLPSWYEMQYEVPYTLPEGFDVQDVTWESSNEDVALIEERSDDVYVSTKQEGEAVITGTLHFGETEFTDTMTVTVSNWFEPDIPGMMFENAGQEPMTFHIKAMNDAVGQKYTVYSLDESIAEVSCDGDGDTKTVTVDPAGPGMTELVVRMDDPNDPQRTIDNYVVLDVIVCDPDAELADITIHSMDDEPITELHIGAGDSPVPVVVHLDPDSIMPFTIQMTTSDPDVAVATRGTDHMSPYVFLIHGGGKSGEADITFYKEGSDAKAVLHVTNEAGVFSFGYPEMFVPEWTELPLDYVLNYEGATINDIIWESDDPGMAAINVKDGEPVLYTADIGDLSVRGILKVNDEEIARCNVFLHIVRWYDSDRGPLKFADVNAEPQSIWLAPDGPVRDWDMEYEFHIADESVAALEKTDNIDDKGRTEYIVRPLSAGKTDIVLTSKDPNDERKDLTIPCLMIQVCEDVKLQKITAESPLYVEPHNRGVIWIGLTPDTVDPARISYSSSDPSIISIERNESNEAMYFYETFDKEGTATLTFSEGKVKTTVTVYVTRLVSTDKEWIPLTYLHGSTAQGSGEVTVTLKGNAAGHEPVIEVWNTGEEEDDNFPLDPEDWPFTVEKTSENAGKTQFTYKLTPVREGNAQIHFRVDLDSTGWRTEGYTRVEVRGQQKLEWDEWKNIEYNERQWQNNEDVYIQVNNTDSPDIFYRVWYTEDETEPADLPHSGEELLASEETQKYHSQFKVMSPYFGNSTMWLAAYARKDGWQDSDLLIARLRVRNNSFEDEIWDEEYRQYIIDNGLTPADLKNTLHVFGIPEEVPYTGDKIIFDNIRVWYGTHQLGEGMDYKVTYANNINPALAAAKKAPTVTITGLGEYTKSYKQTFSIGKMPIDRVREFDTDLSVTTTTPAFITTASTKSVVPKITAALISSSGKKAALKAGTDYTILYYPMNGTDDSHPGYWEHYGDPVSQIPADHNGNYRAVLVPKETSQKIAGFEMDPESEVFQEYCMGMPMIQVFFDDGTRPYLSLNKASLTNAKLLNNLKLEYQGGYDPYEIIRIFKEEKIQVKIGKQVLTPAIFGYDETPAQDGDYVIMVPDDLRAGKNTLELFGQEEETMSEGFRVCGSKSISFTIAPILNISSKTASISGMKTSVELNEHNYFQLFNEYMDDEGNWKWEPDLSKLSVDGNASSIQLKDKSGNVIDPDDYEIFVDNYNGRLGSFKITFAGRPERGYTGQITQTIKIVSADLASLNNAGKLHVSLRDAEDNKVQYSSSGAKPELRVIVEMPWNPEHELTEGKDYTVTYTNNKTVGAQASATITGKGFYKGKLQNAVTFTVVPADVGQLYEWRCPLTAAAADVVYNAKGKANYFKSVPVIYDNGKALKNGKDYKILETRYWYGEDWFDEDGVIRHSKDEPITDGADVPLGAVIHVGARVEMLNPNYIFTYEDERDSMIHMNYRMVSKAKKIASAKVKVNDGKAVYLGNDWNIVPPVTVTLGKTVLTEDDYEIIDIRNNWLIGTASMTIRGKGEYWGTKKITFKITKTPLQ